MKFKIKRTLLNKALSFAYKPILSASDESLPMYVKSVYIEASKKSIGFFGTNLDTLYAYNIEAKNDQCEIEKEGKCLLYAKTFFTLLKKYSGDDWVECETFDNEIINGQEALHNFKVKYKRSNQSLGCELNPKWPADKLKLKNLDNSFKIKSNVFVDSVGRVLFACGNNPERADLRNLCIEFSNNKIFFVATSGPNLAVYESSSEYQQQNKRMLIRKEAIPTEKKILNEENDIVISFGTNSMKNEIIHISHKINGDSFDIYAKPIKIKGPDGNDFPNWENFYNSRLSGVRLASVSKKELYEVLDRLCIVSPYFCSFSIVEKEIVFSAGTHEKIESINCDFNESIVADLTENKKSLCINSSMFRDSVKNINGEIINLYSISLPNGASLIYMNSNEDVNFSFILNTLREEYIEEEEGIMEEYEVPF